MKRRIAVFASGTGSNFEAIADAADTGIISGCEVALCVCDRPGAPVVAKAEARGINTLVLKPSSFSSKEEMEKIIADRLDEEKIELVCLAGYMRIVGKVLLGRYGGRIINLHPSLLPSFPGAHGIRDAFEYGVKVFGVTVHYVDETLDGGRIIAQSAFPYEGESLDELETLIHRTEHRLYPATIEKLLSGQQRNIP